MKPELVLTPTDFVAITNQVFEQAYAGSVIIEGELSDFKVSQNKWVYFNLKDDTSSIRFFGTIYMLPGPLEDGMMLKVSGYPRLHPKFGFSINIQNISLSGEGTIKKAFDLLKDKLTREGIFDDSRKRSLPYPPRKIGLITSSKSAAFADFTKIMKTRFPGVEILLADVQVQGEAAISQISTAIKYFNEQSTGAEVLVITRGGGSLDDLAVFSTEAVTRAVAASRVPTLVAIGHEINISLAELAADVRASTPSNAAEILVPDKRHELMVLGQISTNLNTLLTQTLMDNRNSLQEVKQRSLEALNNIFSDLQQTLTNNKRLLNLLDPSHVIQRGYAIIRQGSSARVSLADIDMSKPIEIEMRDGKINVSKV